MKKKILFLSISLLMAIPLLNSCSVREAKEQSIEENPIAVENNDIVEHGLKVRTVTSGTDGNGNPTQTFSYTTTPENPTLNQIDISISFADSRQNGSSYLTFTHDATNKTVTIACLQAFNSLATLHMESHFNSNVYADVSIHYNPRYTDAFTDTTWNITSTTNNQSNNLFNCFDSIFTSTVSLNTEGAVPHYQGYGFSPLSFDYLTLLDAFTYSINSSPSSVSNITLTSDQDLNDAWIDAVKGGVEDWLDNNKNLFDGVYSSSAYNASTINIITCIQNALIETVAHYSITYSQYQILESALSGRSVTIYFNNIATVSNVQAKLLVDDTETAQGTLYKSFTSQSFSLQNITFAANVFTLPSYSTMSTSSITPEITNMYFKIYWWFFK